MKFLCLILSLFCLTSCVELLDDITLNKDGSGKIKYVINLSSSKLEVVSLLSLDSLNGTKVPDKKEIESKILLFKNTIQQQPGISNVNIESNWNDYILKFSCDFQSVEELQQAVKNTIQIIKNDKNITSENWLEWNGSCLKRNTPNIVIDKLYSLPYISIEKLVDGKYTSITRFDKEILKFDNQKSQISKSKKSLMIQSDAKSLLNNITLLNNKIYIKED